MSERGDDFACSEPQGPGGTWYGDTVVAGGTWYGDTGGGHDTNVVVGGTWYGDTGGGHDTNVVAASMAVVDVFVWAPGNEGNIEINASTTASTDVAVLNGGGGGYGGGVNIDAAADATATALIYVYAPDNQGNIEINASTTAITDVIIDVIIA